MHYLILVSTLLTRLKENFIAIIFNNIEIVLIDFLIFVKNFLDKMNTLSVYSNLIKPEDKSNWFFQVDYPLMWQNNCDVVKFF